MSFYAGLRGAQDGGGRRIRTYGGSLLNGFQDRRFRPLSQPTGARIIATSSWVASLILNQLVPSKKNGPEGRFTMHHWLAASGMSSISS